MNETVNNNSRIEGVGNKAPNTIEEHIYEHAVSAEPPQLNHTQGRLVFMNRRHTNTKKDNKVYSFSATTIASAFDLDEDTLADIAFLHD